jgi:hypothetical protein
MPAVGLPANCLTNYRQLDVYPVFASKATFPDGMKANLDRVVISEKIDGSLVRCGLITHRGMSDNDSQVCK